VFAALAAWATILSSMLAVAQTPPPVPPRVVIGDDICAIMVEVQCEVLDAEGHPLEWAYVSQGGHPLGGAAESSRATDVKGRLRAPVCYQSSHEYREHRPAGQVILEIHGLKGRLSFARSEKEGGRRHAHSGRVARFRG
jgi:hypothetical protein